MLVAMPTVQGERLRKPYAQSLRLLSVLSFSFFSSLPTRDAFGLSDTFRVRATIKLCDGFVAGQTTIEFKYRVGADAALVPADTLSQSLDLAASSGVFEIAVPSTMQSVPIAISAYCRNGDQVSVSSNEQSVSNCDHLALLDTDGDGVPNAYEDADCSNKFSPGDRSNPDNMDSDGDGIRDLAEIAAGTDPADPGSSPRLRIVSGGYFDPDGDGVANPTAWRPSNGSWYIMDGGGPGQHMAFQFGLPGDTPFTYRTANGRSDVGVIRRSGSSYDWYFHGEGYLVEDGTTTPLLHFGGFGDNIVIGPWEGVGVSAPAIARLYDDSWTFFVRKHDGTVRATAWGRAGDVPMPQDYDGDGVFDVAVYRPSEQSLYVIGSIDRQARIIHIGSGTADYSARGDFTGDGRNDLAFWEPASGMFSVLRSNDGLDTAIARFAAGDPSYLVQLQLGLYQVHVPLSWNRNGAYEILTVVDHATGTRYWRDNNDPNGPIRSLSWGLPGDALG